MKTASEKGKALFRGRRLEELSREELYEAIEGLAQLYTSALNQHQEDLRSLL